MKRINKRKNFFSKTIFFGEIGLFLLIFLIPSYLTFAQAPEACKFYGSLHIDGASAPLSTNITAYINGNPVTTQGGMIDVGYYSVYVYDGSNGDTVTFRINNLYDATPTGTWQAKGAIFLPLTVDTGTGGTGTCDLGEDCTNCADWVNYAGYQVRDSGVGYYDQACCNGIVTQIQVV